MKKIIQLAITIIAIQFTVNAQTNAINISMNPINISGLGGLQSYAYGQHNGKWLIIGGRLDGLHQRQPFASFDIAGHNTQLIVVDPVNLIKWTAPLSSLSIPLQEQLKSTNTEFYQTNDYLYILGGYGYSATLGDHTTFSNLTAIDVPNTIDAIINGTSFTSYFRQIIDTNFQVTGGRLDKINNTYYLIGGHKFIGRYNPMGPAHGPGFVQKYTNEIRKFNVTDDGTTITVNHLSYLNDTVNLHRRDFNVTPQILPTGEHGLTAFSGVFQPLIDLPFLNCVNIDSIGYMPNNAFSQYYNHYHCANIPLYAESTNEMHTLFFGGIAQYYDSSGILVQDNNVPFVNTIARITRDASGIMAEYKLPVVMPALLGAGSEFIPIETLPRFSNHVFKLDSLTADSTLLGYIYGGISSTEANIFWVNDGTQSSASSQIFEVWLHKNDTLGLHQLNDQSLGTLKIQVLPNPNDGYFIANYFLKEASDVKITLFTIEGKKIEDVFLKNLPTGIHTYEKRIRKMEKGGTYILSIETKSEKAIQKIIIQP
jgi:hypothetical protein